MPTRYPEQQLDRARRLRRNMTNAEAALWRALRGSRIDGLKFRRQVPVGPYIADFLCFEHRLIVELDGTPHDSDERKNRDSVRDDWLRRQGYNVLRFPNDLVIGGGDIVIDKIQAAIAGVRRL
jgi:very-short-patch-repair endonuclease